MRKMKDSGIAWIGEIPAEWKVYRNKNCFDCSKEIIGEQSAQTQLLSLTTKGIKKKRPEDSAGKVPESYNTYQTVTQNDIVMCLFDLDVSAVFSGRSPFAGMISPAYKILKCKELVCPQFGDYWFSFIFDGRKFKHYSKNLRYTLTYDEFAVLPIILPSIDEQRRSAAFLDEKCAHIDAVIEKTRASIDEYKKLKQAIITRAVTKGLRQGRKMKDSGIEWIGEIPQEWCLKKIKYVTDMSRGLFNHRPRNDSRLYDGEYPFIQTGDVARTIKYINTYSQTLNEFGKKVSKKFPRGTLTMTIAANVGDVAILNFEAYFPDSIVGFVPKSNTDSLFLYYLFSAMKAEFIRTAIQSTQLNLNLERIKEMFVPVPSNKAEQQEIAAYLDAKTAAIDRLIAKKEQLIAEMESCKKSLIYEVVTGKREVAI